MGNLLEAEPILNNFSSYEVTVPGEVYRLTGGSRYKDRIKDLYRSDSFEYKKQQQAEEDVQQTLITEANCYRALGETPPKESSIQRSFEPYLERAKLERLLKDVGDDPKKREKVIQSFKEEEELQMVTNLRERYSSETSRINYALTEANTLRSPYFPDEDYEDVLLRGIIHAKKKGSKDQAREQAELRGFLQIQGIFSNSEAALGTFVVSLSPPSKIKGSRYNKRFVDIWELKKDEKGKRYAQMTRFAAGLSEEGYKNSALKLSPSYFGDSEVLTNLPLDAYFLSHPILIDKGVEFVDKEDLYDKYFERDFKTMKEEAFQEIKKVCLPFIHFFIDELYQEKIDWKKLAIAFNAILNLGDAFVETREKPQIPTTTLPFPSMRWTNLEPLPAFRSQYLPPIEILLEQWGTREVKSIAAGCGLSSGFKIKGGLGIGMSLGQALSNSVASFAICSPESTCSKCNKHKTSECEDCQECGDGDSCKKCA